MASCAKIFPIFFGGGPKKSAEQHLWLRIRSSRLLLEVIHQRVVADQPNSSGSASGTQTDASDWRSMVVCSAWNDEGAERRAGQTGVGTPPLFGQPNPLWRVGALRASGGILVVREGISGEVEKVVAQGVGDNPCQPDSPLGDLLLLIGIELVERPRAGEGEERDGGVENDGAVGNVHSSPVCAPLEAPEKPNFFLLGG